MGFETRKQASSPPLLKLTHVLRYVRCKGSREGGGLKKFPLGKWSRGREGHSTNRRELLMCDVCDLRAQIV